MPSFLEILSGFLSPITKHKHTLPTWDLMHWIEYIYGFEIKISNSKCCWALFFSYVWLFVLQMALIWWYKAYFLCDLDLFTFLSFIFLVIFYIIFSYYCKSTSLTRYRKDKNRINMFVVSPKIFCFVCGKKQEFNPKTKQRQKRERKHNKCPF